MRTVIDSCLFTHCLPKSVPILVYERTADRKSTAVKFLYPNGRSEKPRFDHLVAIERTAPNKHGNYCSMKAEVLREDLIAPIEDIFLEADKDDRISTTCIGDGGNEIGMGKVYESVCSNIRHDEKIASVISCDYLIACGVSNWGGHALAVGLYLLSNCPIHDRYVRRGLVRVTPQKTREDFLNSIKQKEKVLEVLVDEGVRDGVTGISELSVDGFHLYPYHEQHFEYMTNLIDD
ncbi:D-glutamate cyclase, mitochondrial-like [Xenia sp. Carnegie-2017]|nr:D-glutamate cyclase, mitochondrial-like [Xenia sp. Carnegie-2017]